MDKCQSKEGAQKALQDIERFLESSSSYLNCDPQALHYDFESVLTSELKVSKAQLPCQERGAAWAVRQRRPLPRLRAGEGMADSLPSAVPDPVGAGEAGERAQHV